MTLIVVSLSFPASRAKLSREGETTRTSRRITGPNSIVRLVSATGYLTEALRACPTEIRIRRQSRSLVVPAEYARRAEGVPPARSPLALVHREVQLAGMGIVESPAALRLALGLDQVDRLGHPLVPDGAGPAQVVETSEHVVVPIGRVGELRPGRGAMGLTVLVDHLTGRQPAQHPPLRQDLPAAEAAPGPRLGTPP